MYDSKVKLANDCIILSSLYWYNYAAAKYVNNSTGFLGSC